VPTKNFTPECTAARSEVFAECYETFATFAFTVFMCVCVLHGSKCLVVVKVCKGSRLVVFFLVGFCFCIIFWVRNECLNSFYATLRPKWSEPCKKDCGLGFTFGI